MTTLITGATGFIGGHLAHRLARQGDQIRCLVRPRSDASSLGELGAEFATGDLTSPDSVARAVDGCRLVVHCGALVSDWATPQEIECVNTAGTRKLLNASVKASVERFVHFSTTDVYGYPGRGGVEESYVSEQFGNWYAHTKRAAEAEVRAAGREGLQTVILRPATVYGPRSVEVIGEIARAISGRKMLLIGGGRSVAGLCYVDNLVDAALIALEHPAAPGEAFNITDGLQVTWKQFTDDLADGLGSPPARLSLPYWLAIGIGFSLEHCYRLLRAATGLTTAPLLSRLAVQVLGRILDVSNDKARALLVWEPSVDYQAGLLATLGWLRDDYLKS